VRGLIIGALKAALHEASHKASTTVADMALAAFRVPEVQARAEMQPRLAGLNDSVRAYHAPLSAAAHALAQPAPAFARHQHEHHDHRYHDRTPAHDHAHHEPEAPLGLARAQLHDTYIVAETGDGIVIVDQHAAHERLVYERMKKALDNGGVKRQHLLIPEVVEMNESETSRILARSGELASLGLAIESFGPGALLVREVPALLGQIDVKALIRDIADELAETESLSSLKERLDHVSATLACHMSVRSGRRLNQEEMNALLREMETTPHSGQCNHGRPTYVELKLADIERMFGRR
jgi:DNA mismatch repair protein MutL